MKQEVTIPDSIRTRNSFKRKFSFREMYFSFVNAVKAAAVLGKNKKKGILHPDFVERLQLAVTEVNGCAACSYQHTKMALKQGMTNAEISSFLSGGEDYIRAEEAKAIVFAQHFADEKGQYKDYALNSIIEEYGKEKAEVILAACKVMIAGNMYGIPLSAFQARLKGNKYKDSHLFYELSMMIFGFIALPFAILHGILKPKKQL